VDEVPIKRILDGVWYFVRALATDDAYDSYLAHHREMRPESPPMDRRSFYLRQQQQKWSGVQRCC
jgi:uncharacterized short protein YbdD (DUF466 family)